MKKSMNLARKSVLAATFATLSVAAMAPQTASAADELTVAYFLEWPTPRLIAESWSSFRATDNWQ